jgi:hypothetical protein
MELLKDSIIWNKLILLFKEHWLFIIIFIIAITIIFILTEEKETDFIDIKKIKGFIKK